MTQYMNLGGIPYISITVWEITAMKYQSQNNSHFILRFIFLWRGIKLYNQIM